MNHNFPALAIQVDDSSTWIIIGVVLFLLFFVVIIIAIGLVIFFIMRKRKKAAAQMVAGGGAPVGSYASDQALIPEAQVAVDLPPPAYDVATPVEEMRAEVASAPDSGGLEFDPSRTVAIT